MASAEKGWEFTVSNEDPEKTGKVITDIDGGMTRFGIDSRSHPEALARGFYSMPTAEALDFAFDIYRYDYWSGVLGYQIESQLIASKIADMAFNEDPHEATLLLQRAVNRLRSADKQLIVDGRCGVLTIAAVNTYPDQADEEALYASIVYEGAQFYEKLLAEDPDKYQNSYPGWIRRLNKRPS
jgi:lysozyme family protein